MMMARLARNSGLALLLVVATAAAVALGIRIERMTRGEDRALAQEMAIHHFERSSWFARNAGKYEGLDPELTRRFREAAEWHARRANEFRRMDTGNVAREAERDVEHDLADGRLME